MTSFDILRLELRWVVLALASTTALACGSESATEDHASGGRAGSSTAAGNGGAPNSKGGEGGSTDAGGGESAVDEAALAITTQPVLRVVQDSSIELEVSVARQGGAEGAVTLTVMGLPVGVGADDVKVAEGETAATLMITALPTAAQGGPTSITVAATLEGEQLEDEAEVALLVAGAAGDSDTSFGEAGLVTKKVSDREYDALTGAVLDSERRIVVSGIGQGADPWLGWVTRFGADGAFDESFGDAGTITDFGLPSAATVGVVTSGDDIVVGATFYEDGDMPSTVRFLRKFDGEGDVVTSFGTGGDVIVELESFGLLDNFGDGYLALGNFEFAAFDAGGDPQAFATPEGALPYRMAIDADRRVSYAQGSADGPWLVGRLLPSGEPDDSFGTEGVASFPISEGNTFATPRALLLRPSGASVLLAQSRWGGLYENEVALIQFDEHGDADAGFGSEGKVVVTAAGYAVNALLQPDGKVLVLAADRVSDFATDCKLRRFDTSGELDESFADAGTAALDDDCDGQLLLDETAGRVVLVRTLLSGEIELRRYWL